MANDMVPEVRAIVEPEGTSVAWEVDALALRERYNHPRNSLALPPCELQAPTASGTTTIKVESALHVKAASGALVWTLSLPEGVCAWYSRWVGPSQQRMRVCKSSWANAGEWRGGECRSWNLEEHRDGATLRLGLELLLVASEETMPGDDGRFQLGKKIGGGGMAEIKEVHDAVTDRKDLAAKVASRLHDAVGEAQVLERLANTPGFPEVVGVSRVGDQNVLVMQRLYRNLAELQRNADIAPNHRFSADTVIEIGVQSITRLQSLHAEGFIHQDIKPENLMIDNEWGNAIYLIDFGIASHWRAANQHVAFSTLADEGSKGIHGTEKYCSVDAHLGNQSRRSDMESLCFVLISLATGSLPWEELVKNDQLPKEERYDLVLAKKQEPGLLEAYIRKELASQPKLMQALVQFLHSCRSLAFDAEPDYEALCDELLFGRSSPLLMVDSDVVITELSANTCETPGTYAVEEADQSGEGSCGSQQSLLPHTSGGRFFTALARTHQNISTKTAADVSSSRSTLDWQTPIGATARMACSCPAGHALKEFTVGQYKDYYCNECGRQVSHQENVMNCKRCNYDICVSCAQQAWGEHMFKGFLEETLESLGLESLRQFTEKALQSGDVVVKMPSTACDAAGWPHGVTVRVGNLKRFIDAMTHPSRQSSLRSGPPSLRSFTGPPSSLSWMKPPASLRSLKSGPPSVPTIVEGRRTVAAEPEADSYRSNAEESGCFLQRIVRRCCGRAHDPAADLVLHGQPHSLQPRAEASSYLQRHGRQPGQRL